MTTFFDLTKSLEAHIDARESACDRLLTEINAFQETLKTISEIVFMDEEKIDELKLQTRGERL